MQFIASVMDIPNFNFLCEQVPYVRDDPRLNRVCINYFSTKLLSLTYILLLILGFFHPKLFVKSSSTFMTVILVNCISNVISVCALRHILRLPTRKPLSSEWY